MLLNMLMHIENGSSIETTLEMRWEEEKKRVKRTNTNSVHCNDTYTQKQTSSEHKSRTRKKNINKVT